METPSSSPRFFSKLLRFVKGCGQVIVTAWLVLGATLLLIVCLNLAASLGSKVFSAHENPNFWKNVDSYKKAPWLAEYFKEFMEAYDTHWKSYVYFGWNPYKGKYLNINKQGFRITVPSDLKDSDASQKIKVFMFGGSTLWGWGVRDRYTIPSQLVKILSNYKVKADISNLSEPGYVSTQELLELILQLQRGHVPDLVIFYDGINDIYAAYQSGEVGIPQNEWKRKLEYNLTNRYRQLRSLFLLNSIDQFYLGKKIKKLAMKFKEPKKIEYAKGIEKDIAKIYINNIKIVQALSQAYGFKAIYYWQPVIFYKNNLSHFEEKYSNDKALRAFHIKAYTQFRKNLSELSKYNFHDITEIFANVKEPLYIDYCHVNEEGNKMIAARMASDVLQVIKSGNAVKDSK